MLVCRLILAARLFTKESYEDHLFLPAPRAVGVFCICTGSDHVPGALERERERDQRDLRFTIYGLRF